MKHVNYDCEVYTIGGGYGFGHGFGSGYGSGTGSGYRDNYGENYGFVVKAKKILQKLV